jgi:hypothetical protein
VRSSLGRPVAALVAIASLAACSGGGGNGVGVKNLESDVVFGAAEPAKLAPEGVTDAEATGFDELPDQFFEPVHKAPRPTYAQRASVEECPQAALEEFPDKPAPLWGPEEKKEPPREGLYRWQRSGSLKSAETAGVNFQVRGFERRLLRNVEVVATTETPEGGNDITFTYEVVQPEISGSNVLVTTYQVKSVGEPPTRSVFNPTRGQDEITAGEPERGMVIKKIEVLDKDGNQVSTFEPATGLLLIPYRVRPGEVWQSVAVDPKTGQRLQLDGTVLDRGRVDACGDLIEGWQVQSTISSTSDSGATTRQYDYLVAPQYGSILLNEHIVQKDATGTGEEQDVTFTTGQQDPDPLPAGAEEGSA